MPEDKIGVINPYALADIVKGERVDWDEHEKRGTRDSTLADILHTSEDDIFDLSTPILNPLSNSSGHLSGIENARVRINAHFEAGGESDKVKKDKKRISQVLTSGIEGSEVGAGGEWEEDWFDWHDKGDFLLESPRYDERDPMRALDIVQGALPDCYFIAALCSAVWTRPHKTNLDGSIFKIYFYKNNVKSRKILVSDEIPVRKRSRSIIYARSRNQGEIWPGVYEKAYASWISGHVLDRPPYNPIAYGHAVKACSIFFKVLENPTKKNNQYANSHQLWQDVEKNCIGERAVQPMVAWTKEQSSNYKQADIVPNHAYSILGCEKVNDTEYIVLRNPYGVKHATEGTRSGRWSDKDIELNQNGIFSMKADVFKAYFDGLGWAKRKRSMNE